MDRVSQTSIIISSVIVFINYASIFINPRLFLESSKVHNAPLSRNPIVNARLLANVVDATRQAR
jgi:hypothetical protein